MTLLNSLRKMHDSLPQYPTSGTYFTPEALTERVDNYVFGNDFKVYNGLLRSGDLSAMDKFARYLEKRVFFDPCCGVGSFLYGPASLIRSMLFALGMRTGGVYKLDLSRYHGMDMHKEYVLAAGYVLSHMTSRIEDGKGVEVVGVPHLEVHNSLSPSVSWNRFVNFDEKVKGHIVPKDVCLLMAPPFSTAETLESTPEDMESATYWECLSATPKRRRHGDTLDIAFIYKAIDSGFSRFVCISDWGTVDDTRKFTKMVSDGPLPWKEYGGTTKARPVALRMLGKGEENRVRVYERECVNDLFGGITRPKENLPDGKERPCINGSGNVVLHKGSYTDLSGCRYIIPIIQGSSLVPIPDGVYGKGGVYVWRDPSDEAIACFKSRPFQVWWSRSSAAFEPGTKRKQISLTKVVNSFPLNHGEWQRYDDSTLTDDQIYEKLYEAYYRIWRVRVDAAAEERRKESEAKRAYLDAHPEIREKRRRENWLKRKRAAEEAEKSAQPTTPVVPSSAFQAPVARTSVRSIETHGDDTLKILGIIK